MTIIEDRLALLESISLKQGGHRSFEEGVCAMELSAWLAGEPHSASPKCVSPVITSFMVSWNDSLRSDEERDRLLKPLIPLTIGTRTSAEDEETRAWMCTDWLVREQAPAWLRLAGLTDHAVALENLAALTGRESAIVAQPSINEAKKAGDAAWDAARAVAGDAAWAAAWDAAWDAAGAAAGVAAGAAARDAAWDAARVAAGAAAGVAAGAAAGVAARVAARAVAWDAAGAAAWDAARDALSPTVEILQASAGLLVTRMCEVSR